MAQPNIWDAVKQYFNDVSPGGSLNPEYGNKSVMDGYRTPYRQIGPDQIQPTDAISAPTIGPVSLDPTDYITPGGIAKAAAAVKGLLAGAATKGGLLAPAVIGQTVWHGSPHKFDKFDMSKIGTGEGAQAYGHGLYTAEGRDVATEYRKNLSQLYGIGTKVDGAGQSAEIPAWLGDKIRNDGIDAAINEWTQRAVEERNLMKTSIQPWNHEANAVRFEKQLEQMQTMKAANDVNVADPGYLYKVDIPDEAVARFLDWDKPVADELRKPASQAAMQQWGSGLTDTSGEHLYKEVVKNFEWAGSKSPKDDAIKWLNEQGIPGIRYLDGGSRSGGQGTSNFVLFDDKMPRILEVNGQATGNQPWQPGEWQGLLSK